MTRKNALILVLTVGLVWAFADQWTKYLAVRDLTSLFPEEAGLMERLRLFFGTHGLYSLAKTPAEIIPGFWNHVYVQNPAGAFGLLSNAPEYLRKAVFVGFAIIAAVAILVMASLNYGRGMRPAQVGFALIFGGAMGNLIDRLIHGYVIDFIDWHVTLKDKTYHWPAFNLADVGIVVGVIGLFLLFNFQKSPIADTKEEISTKGNEGEEAV